MISLGLLFSANTHIGQTHTFFPIFLFWRISHLLINLFLKVTWCLIFTSRNTPGEWSHSVTNRWTAYLNICFPFCLEGCCPEASPKGPLTHLSQAVVLLFRGRLLIMSFKPYYSELLLSIISLSKLFLVSSLSDPKPLCSEWRLPHLPGSLQVAVFYLFLSQKVTQVSSQTH